MFNGPGVKRSGISEPSGFIIMEANAHRDPERPQDSESNRNLLQPPPGNQQSHRVTNFYIDDILRPDFGLKRKDGGALTGTKAPKPGDPQRDGGGSDEDRSAASDPPPRPHTDTRDAAARTGGEASAAPAARPMLWPAWVYCTRYSDRPSSGWCGNI